MPVLPLGSLGRSQAAEAWPSSFPQPGAAGEGAGLLLPRAPSPSSLSAPRTCPGGAARSCRPRVPCPLPAAHRGLPCRGPAAGQSAAPSPCPRVPGAGRSLRAPPRRVPSAVSRPLSPEEVPQPPGGWPLARTNMEMLFQAL